MNKDFIVTTVPISPKNDRIGIMTWPYLSEGVGKSLNIKSYVAVNNLSSFDNKKTSLNEYIDFLKDNNCEVDNIIVDSDYLDIITKTIQQMLENNTLIIENKNFERCECGRVEHLIDDIDIQDKNAKLYEYVDGKKVCKYCHSECSVHKDNVLLLPLKNNKPDIKIIPNYLKKSVEDFYNRFNDKFFLVSKTHDTGVSVNFNGVKYNIDIDFVCSILLTKFSDSNKIVILGNKHPFKIFKLDYINSILNGGKMIYLCSSYNKKDENFDEEAAFFENNMGEYKKLFILFNQSFSAKTDSKTWSISIYKYLKKLSSDKLLELYKSSNNIYNKSDTDCVDLLQMFVDNINFDKCIRKFKNESK